MEKEVLGKIKSSIQKKSLNESDVDHLMTLIRKQLEHMSESDRTQYALLKFFCNWSKHIKIDRSSVANKIILKLNKTLFKVKDSKDTNEIISKVSNVISFIKLQNQLKKFLEKFDLPNNLVADFDKWREFVNNLIKIIVNSPLVLPDTKKSKAIKPFKKDAVVTQLQLAWINQKVFKPEILTKPEAGISEDDPKLLILHLTMSNTTNILIPYTITWKNKT